MKRLKQGILWITILGSLLYSLALPVIWLDYQVNKDFIAKVFCINKDKPELKCNGKCYLAKKLKKAKKQQEDQTAELRQVSLALAVTALATFTFNTFAEEPLQHFGEVNNLYNFHFLSEIFHPPIV
ncbi:hypothetical protein JMN32_10360 [Fulvivirga sp. 29W222]|uniref:Uncharacterized protein n=1 Tax=Fulvivirga marina TaxID=2494733 RepID=A0A937KBC6_9BACT|nr:hypothetical protein [Fulvivirga marina]MBL6446716.1 hypothetical protein [Fulvivirga marina]